MTLTINGANIKSGKITDLLLAPAKFYNTKWSDVGESKPSEVVHSSSSESGFAYIKGTGKVGNLYIEKVVLPAAVITGAEDGLLNGVNSEFGIPYPYSFPNTVGNYWNLTGLKALYVDPFTYDQYVTYDWYKSLYAKIREFVRTGGTVYLTGDSHTIAHALAREKNIGLEFHASPPSPIYQGNGYNRVFLSGSLKEKVGQDNINIPFMPYITGGPLISSLGKAEKLATAEIILNPGTLTIRSYDVAVYFPYENGRVFYSSFEIPTSLIGAVPPGESAMSAATQATPLQAFARWFMSKPLANAELFRIAEAYSIDNADSESLSNTE